MRVVLMLEAVVEFQILEVFVLRLRSLAFE